MRKIILFIMACVLSACATSPTGRSQLMLISPEHAISASQQAYVQTMQPLEQEGRIDADAAITQRDTLPAETEADLMSIELATRARYTPYAAASLWKKMEQTGGTKPPGFISTHPAPTNRQIALTDIAPRYMDLYLQSETRPVYQFNE